ncbi:MAG TPA: nucleoid occlusion protein [Syntrophomonas sp.]|nr:nucleoid occlusion protein [Syntrophomonas sp.]HRW12254.1 nucleoid occlusion protein [Syntrophomonas sp.]
MEVKKQLEKILHVGSGSRVLELPLEQISPNPFQPRKEFDELELKELAKSISSFGVIQPIIVRKSKQGFQLVAGERRYRACKLIGRQQIPAIVQDIDDQSMAAISLIENLQRKELNYFEEAIAYSTLLNRFGLTQEELAQRVGKSQSAIANKLRLLKIAPEIRNLIITTTITERHARALLKLNTIEMQKEIIRAIYERELTVKETEELVEKAQRNNIPREPKTSNNGQQISMVIRDARIFLNTIKETVNRAKQTGIDMRVFENENENEYEITIKVKKLRKNSRLMAEI